jgi:ATP adenylyltransferase/5',5'''-P-1,P-4-tetraphosphate phosphorylase II
VDSPHYAMYNCTLAAGASREHKHMHIIPRPGSHQKDEGGFRLFPDCESPDQRVAPFRYFKRDLYGSDLEKPISSKALLKIYLDLLAQTRTALGISNESPESICPHNVVLVKEWIVVVPRRSNDFKSVTANAAGMMGSVWLLNEGQLDRWKSLGLRNVLSHLGVPAQEGEDAGSV